MTFWDLLEELWGWLEGLIEVADDPIPDKVDVVIVSGIGRSWTWRSVSSQSAANVQKALALWAAGKAEYLLFVGAGADWRPGELTEADSMRQYAGLSIPDERCFLERGSTFTFENADFSLPILLEHGWKTAVVVTQQLTARRVRAIYRRRWEGSGTKFFVVKARSNYGGNSQWRWNHFLLALGWDLLGWAGGWVRGHC